DGDGCTDEQELGVDETLGGRRNYLNSWDFYDVNGDLVVNLVNDILGVARAFGPSTGPDYDPAMDRSPAPAPGVDPADPAVMEPWDTGPPDGSINIPTDLLGVAIQFGHRCT
ncbi:MAG: hypothetical protein J4N26_05245, partial [Chloroflexi bacterium]|nr:hypothetical protein [Chloroflexota bacterium]